MAKVKMRSRKINSSAICEAMVVGVSFDWAR
jgi:hypothetical protein